MMNLMVWLETILLFQYAGMAVVAGFNKQYYKMVYWGGAFILTFAVVEGMKQ